MMFYEFLTNAYKFSKKTIKECMFYLENKCAQASAAFAADSREGGNLGKMKFQRTRHLDFRLRGNDAGEF